MREQTPRPRVRPAANPHLRCPARAGRASALGLLLALVACLAPVPVAAELPVPPGMWVGVGNHQLHVNCKGEGSPTVIFESGLGGTSLDWVKVQREVSRFTRACSYDRAGYGWSEELRRPRTGDALVSDLRRLSIYASLRAPYVLVGHSIGGVLVRRFAERYPDTVAGLVLVDSSHEEQFRRMEAAGLPVASAPARGRTFVVSNYWSIPDGLPAELRTLARRLAIRPAAVKTLYKEMAGLRGIVEGRVPGATLPDVPLTVIARGPPAPDSLPAGAARVMASLWQEMQDELARDTPGSMLVRAEGSGHYVHLDRPEVVVDAVRSMVAQVRADRASVAGTRPARVDIPLPAR